MKITKKSLSTGQWWHTPLIPAPEIAEAGDLSEFETGLIYKSSSRTGRNVKQKNPVL